MKKIILVLVISAVGVVSSLFFKNLTCTVHQAKKNLTCSIDLKACRDNLLKYLKLRKEGLAELEIEKILSIQRDDVCALWAKAEILRRDYKFEESKELLKQVLWQCPGHASSLISLAYIEYYDNKFQDASRLLKEALRQPDLDRENQALIYMLMGSINAKKASRRGFLSKVAYGARIAGYFERAKNIAPDLSEARLGLGTFYLLAPKIAGGNIERAIEELECAVKLTPDFATVNARLAQAYKHKGDLKKYDYYLRKAKELDPDNETAKEIEALL